MDSRVSIIILNWNGWKDTIECLESLHQINYSNYNVILVDNGSEDDSVEKIREYCAGKIEIESNFFEYNSNNKPIELLELTKEECKTIKTIPNEFLKLSSNKKLILIKNHENYGFAEGNNIGIRYALNYLIPDYILLLNNDTVVDKDFLSKMVKLSQSNRNIGFTGPKSYYYDHKGRNDVINFAGGSLNRYKGHSHSTGMDEVDKGQYDKIKTVEYVEGSCLLVKKEVLEKIGLLDTKYFAYWEEVDLCVRGYKAGYKSIYVPKAKIWHKVSSSTDNPTKIYYYTRNKLWFMQKNAKMMQYICFLMYFLLFRFWFEVGVFIVYHNNIDAFYSLCKGTITGLIDK